MKIKFTLLLIAVCLLQSSAYSAVSVGTTLTEDYMLNSGYSEQMYDSANVSRARALGKEFYSREELKYKNSSAPVRFLRRMHQYVDPAIDDFSFYHHDTDPEPGIDDL